MLVIVQANIVEVKPVNKHLGDGCDSASVTPDLK